MRRHDDVTTSSDASSSEDNGLNKHYKRAWDSLRDSGDVEKALQNQRQGRRGHNDEAATTTRSGHEGMRDGSEMTVNDVAAMYTRPEKRRHHHHHHSHRHQRDHHEHDKHETRDWRDRDRRKY